MNQFPVVAIHQPVAAVVRLLCTVQLGQVCEDLKRQLQDFVELCCDQIAVVSTCCMTMSMSKMRTETATCVEVNSEGSSNQEIILSSCLRVIRFAENASLSVVLAIDRQFQWVY